MRCTRASACSRALGSVNDNRILKKTGTYLVTVLINGQPLPLPCHYLTSAVSYLKLKAARSKCQKFRSSEKSFHERHCPSRLPQVRFEQPHERLKQLHGPNFPSVFVSFRLFDFVSFIYENGNRCCSHSCHSVRNTIFAHFKCLACISASVFHLILQIGSVALALELALTLALALAGALALAQALALKLALGQRLGSAHSYGLKSGL